MVSGWEKVHLKSLLSTPIRNGYSPIANDIETGYWVLSLGALGDEKLNINECKPVAYSEKIQANLLQYGDFIVSRSNTPDKVGRSALFRGELACCAYPDLMMKFRIDETKANLFFIEQVLKSKTIRDYFSNSAAGSSSTMVKINKTILEKTPILLPPLEAQTKIAEILSTWDNAIATTEQLLVNSEQQKKALMQQLLKNQKNWQSQALKNIAIIRKGQQLNKSTLSEKGQYAVINGGILPSGYTTNFNCSANTITISEGGNSCGYVAYQKDPFWCGAHCYTLSENKIDDLFLYHLLKFNEPSIMQLRVGSGLPNIQKKTLENFTLTFPQAREEQQKIAEILTTADQEIAILAQKLECLKQEKKALMQELLSGKKQVNVHKYI